MNRYDILLEKKPPEKPFFPASKTLTIEDIDRMKKLIGKRMPPRSIMPIYPSAMNFELPKMAFKESKNEEETFNYRMRTVPISLVIPIPTLGPNTIV
jgi:hypothetical protein